jgi:hypothetical protein
MLGGFSDGLNSRFMIPDASSIGSVGAHDHLVDVKIILAERWLFLKDIFHHCGTKTLAVMVASLGEAIRLLLLLGVLHNLVEGFFTFATWCLLVFNEFFFFDSQAALSCNQTWEQIDVVEIAGGVSLLCTVLVGAGGLLH